MEHILDFSAPSVSQPVSIAPGERLVSRRGFMRYLGAGAAALAVQGCGGGGGGTGASATITPAAPVATNPSPTPVEPTPAVPVVDTTPVVTAAPPVGDGALVWLPIPALVFTQGVPASISIANYVSVSNVAAFTVSLNGTPLPAGVTFNGATRSFDYDGRGSTAISDGHVLTAAVL